MEYIERAVKFLAYDNGAVNRFSTEAEVVEKTMAALKEEFTEGDLATVENSLALLTEEELESVILESDDNMDDNDKTMARVGQLVGCADIHTLVDRVLNCAFDNI